MKSIPEWTADITSMQTDLLHWAQSNQGKWRNHAIFLGVLLAMVLLSLLMGLDRPAMVFSFFFGIQLLRVMYTTIKDFIKKKFKR